MPLTGFFFDFDGTLVPLDEDRRTVMLSRDVVLMLHYLIEKGFKVAVISGKDCEFLKKKIPTNLNGFGCVNGLEIVGGGYIVIDEKVLDERIADIMNKLLNFCEENLGGKAFVEVKRILNRYIGGISIDWRFHGLRPKEVTKVVEFAKLNKLTVIGYPNYPFLDIYVSYREKDHSLKILKTLLGLSRVIYFGDSENDLYAFKEADVSVLVKHSYNEQFNPKVSYIVKFKDLPKWVIENASSI